MAVLDPAAVAAVDSTRQAADILGLPDHLEDAPQRVAQVDAEVADLSGLARAVDRGDRLGVQGHGH